MTSETMILQPLRHTLFFSRAADRKREQEATLAAIATMIQNTAAREKSLLPWIKLAVFGEARTDKGSLRHDANVLAITGIEADYDGESMSFDAAHERLVKQGVLAILYTSPSHTEARPRWRVLCPLSTPTQPRHRARLMGRLNGLFGGLFAGESWTLSQSYYFGGVRMNRAHRVELVDGQPIDLQDDLDEIWLGKSGATSGTLPASGDAAGTGEARDDAELVRRIVTGEGLHAEMCALSGRYLARGVTSAATAEILRGLMLSHPEAARDDRWRDRYGSIPALVASAAAKYQGETAEGRRAVARLIARMAREGCPSDAIRAAAFREAERYDLPPKVAEDIAAWMAARERARRGGAHGRL